VAERVAGLAVIIIHQVGETGSLYSSVVSRNIAVACTAAGLTVSREQVLLGEPIKAIGVSSVQVELHPEVQIPVKVNVARSREEAEKQACGEAVGQAAEAESPEAELAA